MSGDAADGRGIRRRGGQDQLQRPPVLSRVQQLERVVEMGRAECLIHLVNDNVAHALELELLPLKGELADAAGCADDHARLLFFDLLQLPVGVGAPDHCGGAHAAALQHRLGDAVDLKGQLARRAEDEELRRALLGVKPLQQREQKRKRLARARPRVDDCVATRGNRLKRRPLQRIGCGDVGRREIIDDAIHRDAEAVKVRQRGICVRHDARRRVCKDFHLLQWDFASVRNRGSLSRLGDLRRVASAKPSR